MFGIDKIVGGIT